ncbi:MAG: hypothetical protein Q7S58_09625 [Candidatus Binatus sp.]|uniref:hypothetical protein n=1 Tax=Candidatus Binatus sp. TaxID=2811406 RepID=UPI002717ED0E|nr:hypothetical protein [Candidatus Binatus sp.]MDO8432655.1 hypothetical protein [Candidatus Binatus sp.]
MATITQGDFSIFGFFESREAGRFGEGGSRNNGTPTTYSHPLPTLTTIATPGTAATESGGTFEFNRWDLVEMRQLADIRPDYHFVKNYKLLGRFDTYILKDADFFAFYRPWYDAFGTLKNKGACQPNRDCINYSHQDLQQQYFRNDLHEYYGQLNFTDNFSVRIGKQQVIWSEADALSGTEVTNTVDSTYHWIHFESAENLRKNVRMIKLNYILPDYFRTANNELEAFIIPGDYQGNGFKVQTGDPRNPWIFPSATQLGAFNQNGQAFREVTFRDQGQKPMINIGGIFADFAVRNNTKPPTNSLQNSEFGIRYSSLLPIGNGLQASFIYLYEARDSRLGLCTACSALDAAFGTSKIMGSGGAASNWTHIAPGQFLNNGNFIYGKPRPGVPKAGTFLVMIDQDIRRNHFFGLTGTYYDKDLTDVVYRYDILYEPTFGGACVGCSVSGSDWTTRTRWILAGDRPTYIPWLSKQHTFLVAQNVVTWFPNRPSNSIPYFGNSAGKLREFSDFAILAAVNWMMNGQLVTTNSVAWDIDDNTGGLSSTNVYRYSRNILFGVNAQMYIGRSGRNTDPFVESRAQRIQELEFTLTYEI